jgi:glycogen operon protein
VDKLGAFFDIIHQDPVLSQVKLIAEPWDLGEGGYQVGNFPVLWTEWNGKYRDCVRRFWRGDGGTVAEMATRMAGSADLYAHSGRRPYASINFVTSHDGFTLQDLVSYEQKHNEANGEDNRDGDNHNLSWNGGVEGPTDNPAIRALRQRQKRNFLATLFLSQGVPMISGGDEMGRTQSGNNNAYCQDNEISWLNWDLTPDQEELLKFTRRVVTLFQDQPVFRRRRFFHGQEIQGAEAPEIAWLDPAGAEMSGDSWNKGFVRCLGVQLFGGKIDVDDHGEWIRGDNMLLLFNADHANTISFILPEVDEQDGPWERMIDTAQDGIENEMIVSQSYPLEPCSMVVLRSRVPSEEEAIL